MWLTLQVTPVNCLNVLENEERIASIVFVFAIGLGNYSIDFNAVFSNRVIREEGFYNMYSI